MALFSQLAKTVAVLTKDSWMFKLSLLMVLTLPQETESSRVMSSLHSRIRMAFERRLRWTRELQLNEAQVPEPDMSTIMTGIKNLSILSGIALKFMGSKWSTNVRGNSRWQTARTLQSSVERKTLNVSREKNLPRCDVDSYENDLLKCLKLKLAVTRIYFNFSLCN